MKLGLKETFTGANGLTFGAALNAVIMGASLQQGDWASAAVYGALMTGCLMVSAFIRDFSIKNQSLDNN